MISSRIIPPSLPTREWDKLRKSFKELSAEEQERIRVSAVNQGRYILDQFRVLSTTAYGGERQTGEGRLCHLRRP